jgi:glycosyltransferase involved in cell wall biosynthesis
MAAAILQLARSEDLRAQWPRNAREAFAARFSLETMVDGYMNLYRSRSQA